MNDQARDLPEVGPDEDVASALVDGEATMAEQARADDATVAPAVAAFRAVAARVGAPVEPPSDEHREAAIGAALAAFDRGATDEPVTPTVDLGARRAARRRAPEWLTAVAAALVVLAGLGLLAGLLRSGGDDDDAGETAAATADADEGTEETAAGEAFDDAGAATGGAGADALEYAALPYLGEFDDVDGLLDVARADFSARLASEDAAEDDTGESGAPTTTAAQAAPTAGSVPPVPCAGAVGAVDSSTLLGTATIEGQPATVVLETDEDGEQSLVVFIEPACEPERVPFEP